MIKISGKNFSREKIWKSWFYLRKISVNNNCTTLVFFILSSDLLNKYVQYIDDILELGYIGLGYIG